MRFLLFDFLNLMHRAYHAYPRTLETHTGEQTNAVYGISNIVLNSIKKLSPTHIICASEKGPSFRHLAFAPYKENRGWRKERPDEAEEFDKQIPRALEVLETLKIPVISAKGYEADDIIGTICKQPQESKHSEIIIVSSDQDFLQLIDKQTKVFRPARPPFIKEKLWDIDAVKNTYQINPLQLIDYKALRGDPSDNIPGVQGIGEKTALSLVRKHGSIESIYTNIKYITPNSLKLKLAEGAEIANMSKKLSTIVTNAPISFDIKKCLWGTFDPKKVMGLFLDLEFKSLLSKVPGIPRVLNTAKSPKYPNTNLNQLDLFLS
jgi:DNA polymerase-1